MKRWLSPIIVMMAVLGGACSREVRADGRVGIQSPTDQASDVARAANPNALAPAPIETPKYRDVTIPAGTKLGVRLNTSVASNANKVEDPVEATLIAPVKIGQSQVIPAGSHIKGYVSSAQQSGKVKGRASLAISFRTLTVGSETYPITAQISRVAPATKKQDAEKIAIPAAGGAGIGALVGGKEGAAIGAAVGGGAGTAVVLSTRGKEVSLPHGSVLSLRLQKPVTVRVPTK